MKTRFVGTIPFASSSLDQASNPADPLVRYGPVYLNYLDL